MISVRINTLKTTREEMISFFDQSNIEYEMISWYSQAFILKNVTAKYITELNLYKEGKLYIQSLSSMIPALVLNPTVQDRVLDVAAAPGSKTTQMAMLMENQGEIVVNDISHDRLYKLKANIAHYGVKNIKVTHVDGRSIWKKFPEYFDKVLLDAPCSMNNKLSGKKIKQLSNLQKWLLRSAVSSAKVGGIIVYSTCTQTVEENEEVIQWVLEKEKEAVKLENIHLEKFPMEPGLLGLSQTGRIAPNDRMEAFYVAKLKKVKSNIISFGRSFKTRAKKTD